ncbi:MAG: DegT/DnrJ/EryC1/StrS family aminotransferase [Clostridia bacterium]|nr:DegT/DnrJ/EryC1/StrS family aminotransferase [Clostridia bacterium]
MSPPFSYQPQRLLQRDGDLRQRLSGVKGIRLCPPQKDVEPNYAYFPVVFDGFGADRDEIFAALGAQEITARKYFYPITNSFACYADLPAAGAEKTPVAAYMADRVLTLPLYADLAIADVERICDIILSCQK